MKLVYQYMAIFFICSPTSNHLHPLQVKNCDSNSLFAVDEDGGGGGEGVPDVYRAVNPGQNTAPQSPTILHRIKDSPPSMKWKSAIQSSVCMVCGVHCLPLVSREMSSQQTRDLHPMLVQCWPTVYDVGPTLKQHWMSVSCLLGWAGCHSGQISDQCPLNAGPMS